MGADMRLTLRHLSANTLASPHRVEDLHVQQLIPEFSIEAIPVTILPFYLSLGIDLLSVWTFRLLRVFRGLKLARHSGVRSMRPV